MTYQHIFSHGFDVDNITAQDSRLLLQRHYDLKEWLKHNAQYEYIFNTKYNKQGIIVDFTNKDDYTRYTEYANNYYEIFLHN